MQLQAAEWKRVLALLDQALELPASEREGWLAQLTAEPADIRQALRTLLKQRAQIETNDFLAAGPQLHAASAAETAASTLSEQQTLGPWHLLREIGRGGMASVWLAERADGAHRRLVALKLPHATHGLAYVVGARFVRERRILSTLRHPHIAQVLDAGAEGAQPWLAMEFVDGQPITRHAIERKLPPAARLRLFLAVLGAVQHAHAQLVIHRDIKPANVLVDEAGHVKLLDFGVAKLLQEEDVAEDDTALTQLGGRAMTPQYASPEQIAGQALGTATDIYSLGVLLYELLTGTWPYVVRRGTAAALEEAIAASELRRPSQAVADKSLARALAGDIDTVVMKALAAVPQDRYASAAAFAEDVERVLARQPIKARPASVAYRLRKLWSRQKWALTAGAAVMSTVLGATAAALWQARAAQQQSRQAEAVQEFLATTLGGNDPQVAQGRTLSARELLDRSAAQIDRDFAKTPEVQARLHLTVGRIYISMGDIEAAEPHARRAVAGYESLGRKGIGSPQHLEALFIQHEVLVELQRWDEARMATERAILLTDRHAGAGNPWAARLRSSLGWVALKQGRLAEAVRASEEAAALQRSLTGESSREYLHTAGSLSMVYVQAGELARASELSRRINEMGARLPGYEVTDRLVDRGNLAHILVNLGDHAAALVVYDALLPEMIQHLGERHDRTVQMRSQWAQAMAERGRYAEAVKEQRRNLEVVASSVGIEEEAYTLQQAVLGRLLRLAGQPGQGLVLSRAAAADFDRRYAEPTWFRERARWLAGEAQLASGDAERGLEEIRRVQPGLESLLPLPHHWAKAEIRLVLAVAQRIEQPAEAVALADEACALLRAGGENSALRLPRCLMLTAWLQGRVAPDVRAAHQGFVAARNTALVDLPSLHPLRAQMLAAEAELLRRDPTLASRASELERQADVDHQRAIGIPLPSPMRLLH